MNSLLTPYILLDAAAVVLLIIFLVRGARRGLILSLVSLVAVFVALAGAGFAARQLSPQVGAWLEPRISSSVTQAVASVWGQDAAAEAEQVELESAGEGQTLLEKLGLSDTLAADVLRGFEKKLSALGGATVETLTGQLAQTIAAVLVFVVAFVLILLALWLIGHALDLAARLPVLHTLNRLLGGALGLIKGALVLFLVIWLLSLWGNPAAQDAISQTYLLRWFSRTNPVSLLRLVG